jgi:putative transposase
VETSEGGVPFGSARTEPGVDTPGKGDTAHEGAEHRATDRVKAILGDVEAFARQRIQSWFERLLEEEVEELLGRTRYERRNGIDAPVGYRNGLGKPRRLTLSAGTITVRRPRVCGLTERFESRLLPLFKRQTETVGALLPTLYLHGLAEGDFDLALRGLLGESAPLSASSIARLKGHLAGRLRRLEDALAGGLGAGVPLGGRGLRQGGAAMLVIVAGLREGRKVVLAVESGYREATESWAALLRDLKVRGLRPPRLVVGRRPSGHLGRAVGGAPAGPAAALLEPSDPEPARQAAEAAAGRGAVPPQSNPLLRDPRCRRATEAGIPELVRQEGHGRRRGPALDQDWDRLVTFYDFPKAHWKHLRTTNPVESPFAAVRLRTAAAKRYKKVENAIAVIWKTLLIAQRTFRRLDAPELLAEVAEGVAYVNGSE